MSDPIAVDPFVLVVHGDREQSLDDIADDLCHALSDLRRLNPSLARVASSAPLPAGAAVRLPPSLAHRGAPAGGAFLLGAAEEGLRALDLRLDALVAREAAPLPPPPLRQVASKAERAAAAVRAEAARQLERIRAEHSECGRRVAQLRLLVDVRPVAQCLADIDAAFDGGRLGLRALSAPGPGAAEPQLQWKAKMAMEREKKERREREREDEMEGAGERTVADESEDFCVAAHTHRWEFAFLAPESPCEAQDVWAVLACQSLGALLDAFECRNCTPVNTSRNAFLFIGGTFYVDDRHSGDPDFADLTVPIRHFDPCTGEVGEARNAAFGACPVRYVSQTTFADLNVRMGEFCLLRHLGWCNHYFYLRSVNSLRGSTRRERRDYPHRVMKASTRAVRCRMCQEFPATIMCYNDEMSPDNPCPYCEPCYTLLHANEEGIVDEGQFVVVKLRDGKYFVL